MIDPTDKDYVAWRNANVYTDMHRMTDAATEYWKRRVNDYFNGPANARHVGDMIVRMAELFADRRAADERCKVLEAKIKDYEQCEFAWEQSRRKCEYLERQVAAAEALAEQVKRFCDDAGYLIGENSGHYLGRELAAYEAAKEGKSET